MSLLTKLVPHWEKNANLALCDLNESTVQKTRKLCSRSEEHMVSAFDISSSDNSNAFVTSVIEKLGQIDHIFNCAGVNPTPTLITDVTDEYWVRRVGANMKSTFNITRACVPHLKSGASFVNVSSGLGPAPAANFAVYSATKFAVIGFSRCMALELGPKGIRVNVVAPEFISTETNPQILAGAAAIEGANKVALGRFGTPEEIADIVAFLFSDDIRYMNGSVVEVNGGRV